MTIRPHDTEQILDALKEAIRRVRAEVSRGRRDDFMAEEIFIDIANDLAWLHGAVEAEAKKADEAFEQFCEDAVMARWFMERLPEGARPKPIDVKPSPGHRARYLGGTVTGDDARIRFSRADKRERIADEVERGEHRDD